MSYEETLKYIHNVKWQASKPGLHAGLKSLGNPEKHLKFVHRRNERQGPMAACIASILHADKKACMVALHPAL